MSRVTISLVTFNSERYLPDFCESLQRQSFTDWDLIVVDNNSYDASAAIVSEYIPRAKIIRQKTNTGYSRAHNLVIAWSNTPYMLFTNPDIVMEEDYIEKLVTALDTHDDVAEVNGKLLYWDVDANVKTDRIDSTGIEITRSYRVRERLQGTQDQAMKPEYVFGFSGALFMIRREALETVRFPKSGSTAGAKAEQYEYFDEDFFAYKEDVDLAWRLVATGWKNYFLPTAHAYHHRNIAQRNASWRERRKRSAINRYSYRNHILMVYKNQYWSLTLRHCYSIWWFEAKKFFYLLFLDGSSLRGLGEALRLLPQFRKKRNFARSHRTIRASELAHWLR